MIDFDDLEDTRGDDELFLDLDAKGIPRGACLGCGRKCRVWVRGPSCLDFCHDCECPTSNHEDLSLQMSPMLRAFPSEYDMKAAVKAGIPLSCCTAWSSVERTIYGLTRGSVRPEACRSRLEEVAASQEREMISVICPTTDRRHVYHELLYENYRRQTYEPRELIVFDTGHVPSTFLKEQAELDKSLVYYWVPLEGTAISVGSKRNICCYLAKGSIIAHFDDDDIYAPHYLEHMAEQILNYTSAAAKNSAGQAVSLGQFDEDHMGNLCIATLRSWHVFDTGSWQFKFYDVSSDENMTWKEQRQWIFGWGFSYVYTKASFEACGFPDQSCCEDDVFIKSVKRLGGKILCVDGSPVLASHTYHPRVSISGGENHGGVSCGKPLRVPPSPFLNSLPKLVKAEAPPCTSYGVVGSWSAWQTVEPLTLERRGDGGLRYVVSIPVVNSPATLMFVVVADGDRSRVFYPDFAHPKTALGPWSCDGIAWSVDVPEHHHCLELKWNPKESCVDWTLSKQLPMRFYVIGNWSEWSSWHEMAAEDTNPVMRRLVVCGIRRRQVSFQIAEDMNWDRRYYLEESCCVGPGPPPRDGMNWVIRAPAEIDDKAPYNIDISFNLRSRVVTVRSVAA